MKKIYGLYGDCHHDPAVVSACLRSVFDDEIILLEDPALLPWENMAGEVLLYVSMKETNTTLKPDGTIDHWITPEREQALWDYVHQGGAALFVHNGLVGFADRPLYRQLAGGLFIDHPPICHVDYAPAGRPHIITEGVEPFGGEDEKYFCHISAPAESLFLCGQEPQYPTTLCGWNQTFGLGRTAAVTPGHTFEIVESPQMQRLVKNAAEWVLKKR